MVDARPESGARRTAVALRLVEEGAILVHQICSRRADIELYAEAGAVPHIDEPIRDDGVWQPVDEGVPPAGLADRIYTGNVVARHGGTDAASSRRPSAPTCSRSR